jgi:[acyl-carrier-protein] S-malonyltransferase
VDGGCTTFLELGPGRVLTGLVRQIHPDAELATAESPEALREFAEAHPDFTA